MSKFNFFIRNTEGSTSLTRRVSIESIWVSVNGENAKQTAYTVKDGIDRVAKDEKFIGNEYSNSYFAALKTFIAMGKNTTFTFTVDKNNTVFVEA
jgi:hypothetical protein